MSPLDHLSRLDAAQLGTGLSAENARAGWAAAVRCAREVEIERVIHGEPPRCITIVASANVFTAPLEWAWALSARGVRVILKSARHLSVVGEALAEMIPGVEHREWRGGDVAAEQAAFAESDAAIVFGSAETIAEITGRSRIPVLGFGPRFGIAQLATLGAREAEGVALDHVLYDGRGCMSPAAVFVHGGVDLDAMASAMAHAQVVWPRGEVSPAEAVEMRALSMLARVEGRMSGGADWLVVELPACHFRPRGLPRAVVIHRADRAEVVRTLAPWGAQLGTVAGLACPTALRECAVGEMQTPRGDRLTHDGVDVLAELWAIGGRRERSALHS